MSDFDFKEIKDFANHLSAIRFSSDEFKLDAAKEAAKVLNASLKALTPVGQYPEGSGKQGGTLRRGWLLSPPVLEGLDVIVESTNNVYYGPYVNYGHRTRNGGGKGWVEGQFFVENALADVNGSLDPILTARYMAYLEQLMGGG